MDYYIHLLILICIYLILAQSFNLTFGMGRLFNLAHVAVYAIGAYATALLSTDMGAGFFQCLAVSMLLSGLFALLIGAISLRLEAEYFAIGTLAFSSVIAALLVNWKSLTRGVLGIPGIPRPELLGVDFSVNLHFLYLIFVFVVISQFVLYIFFRNSFSRSLRGQAEADHACMALGKDTRQIRNFSFFISSAFAGMAGSFFAYYINYIDPSSFSLVEMVFVLTIVVVGKPGSFWGVIAGTVFLVLLPEPLRFLKVPYVTFAANAPWFVQSLYFDYIPPSILGPMRQLLYASIQFGVVYWKRESLFPVERSI